MRTRHGERLILATLAVALFAAHVAFTALAQDAAPAAGPSAADELALTQSRIADKYAKLEQLMLKMAELEGLTNPKRAQLLTRAVGQSKDRLTKTQLEAVVKLLNQQQLKRALDSQTTVQADLKALLELLMSEDRSDRNKSEQQRIKEYIKEVDRLIRLEKSVQGQTEGGADTKRLAQEQGRIAGQTGELARKIRENEEGAADGEKPADQKAADQDPAGDQKSEGQEGQKGQPNQGKQGQKGKSGQKGQQGKGQDQQGKKSDQEGEKGKSDEENKSGDQEKSGEQKSGDQQQGQGEGKQKSGDQKSDKNQNAKGQKGDQSKGDQSKGEQGEQSKSEQGEQSQDQQGQKGQQGKSQKGQKGQKSQKGQQGKQGEQSEQNQEEQPSQEQQDDQSQNPARQRLDRAQQRMQDAQKKLEEAKRKESVEDQRAAREELEKAKAELEQILRQLREEEISRTLAQLEARFRKMLEMQLTVYESSRRLHQVPAERRGEQFLVQSGKLSADERKIAVEAQKALALLEEEGSSIAFPATVEQMHEDMEQVAERLADAKIDDITIGVEEDIVAALEELIQALQQAQRDRDEDERQRQQQQQQMQEGEEPLVDQIAELKMIKSLQERVNKRTQRYSRLLADDKDPIGQAEAPDLASAVRLLSERQQEIFQITRDIVLGKNQ